MFVELLLIAQMFIGSMVICGAYIQLIARYNERVAEIEKLKQQLDELRKHGGGA